jgi:hypothetical protein
MVVQQEIYQANSALNNYKKNIENIGDCTFWGDFFLLLSVY